MLGKAILEANEKGSGKKYWRSVVMETTSNSALRAECISYYNDCVRLDKDWDRELQKVEQGSKTAKQYRVEFREILDMARRYRKAINFPGYG